MLFNLLLLYARLQDTFIKENIMKKVLVFSLLAFFTFDANGMHNKELSSNSSKSSLLDLSGNNVNPNHKKITKKQTRNVLYGSWKYEEEAYTHRNYVLLRYNKDKNAPEILNKIGSNCHIYLENQGNRLELEIKNIKSGDNVIIICFSDSDEKFSEEGVVYKFICDQTIPAPSLCEFRYHGES